jgi:hypothetical protein
MQAMVRQVVDIPVDQALYLEIIGQPHTRMGDAHGKTVLGLVRRPSAETADIEAISVATYIKQLGTASPRSNRICARLAKISEPDGFAYLAGGCTAAAQSHTESEDKTDPRQPRNQQDHVAERHRPERDMQK